MNDIILYMYVYDAYICPNNNDLCDKFEMTKMLFAIYYSERANISERRNK